MSNQNTNSLKCVAPFCENQSTTINHFDGGRNYYLCTGHSRFLKLIADSEGWVLRRKLVSEKELMEKKK